MNTTKDFDQQEEVRKCIQLLNEVFELNPNIDTNIFVSAMINIIIGSYIVNGKSKKYFLKSVTEMADAFDKNWSK